MIDEREKLIADALHGILEYAETDSLVTKQHVEALVAEVAPKLAERLADALATAPEMDEAKLAEVIRVANSRWEELVRWNRYDADVNPHPGNPDDFVARAVAEYLRGER